MRKSIALLLVFVLAFSCLTLAVHAVEEPVVTFPENYHVYRKIQSHLSVPGMPARIKGSFDYDENKAEYYREYSMYGDDGISFPLAESYGQFYNVSVRHEGTIMYFEYTLKKGVTLDDYLDTLYHMGFSDISDKEGENHGFPLLDVAIKLLGPYETGVYKFNVIDCVDTNGKVLFKDGQRTGSGYGFMGGYMMPITSDIEPVLPTEATDTTNYKYKSKLLSQFGLRDYKLEGYDEIYEHESGGTIDWAIVKATDRTNGDHTYDPQYLEFGNRVLAADYPDKPFVYGVGIYSVKADRFLQLSDPAVYKLKDIEKVWTEVGIGRLIGDMNADNELDAIDATLLQRCLTGIMDYPMDDENYLTHSENNPTHWFSDFNQDGERDIIDVTSMQRYLIGLPYHHSTWAPYPNNNHPQTPTEVKPTEDLFPSDEDPDSSIPTITGFKSVGKGVEIHLSRVKGAEKYRVYYYGSKGWTKMGETEGSVFIDDDVNVGSTYRYTVRCIKADLSEFTSDFNHEGWSYTYKPELDTPVITDLEAVLNGIKISWDPVEGADLYRVYYSNSTTYNQWKKIEDTKDTSCIHLGVDYEYTRYTIRCLSCKGKDFASDYNRYSYGINRYYTPLIDELITRNDCMEIHMDSEMISRYNNLCIFRKTPSGWKKISPVPATEDTHIPTKKIGVTFFDYDVEPNKTYTYTARYISADDNRYLSWFNTTGWTATYSAENYTPELEYATYLGDNRMMIQAKDNKFGIKRYDLMLGALYVEDESEIIKMDDKPICIEAPEIREGTNMSLYLIGTDNEGKQITVSQPQNTVVYMISAPNNFTVHKTGDREYTFTWWNGYYEVHDQLSLFTENKEYTIDSGLLSYNTYTVDLSDYPEDLTWTCLLWTRKNDTVSLSVPITLELREADYH